jgi:predicted phosphoribosyltransferase
MRLYRNREEAGQLLAQRLHPWKRQHPLVLAIPRGGLLLGRAMADSLEGHLDIVLVRKIAAPRNPEYALGAVGEGEAPLWNPGALEETDEAWRAEALKEARLELARRRERYTPGRNAPALRGRICVVVDDGVATGASLLAALQLLRKQGPRRLIAAAAVAPQEALEALKPAADELCILHTPAFFHAVGDYFEDFHQLSDEEAIAALAPNV